MKLSRNQNNVILAVICKHYNFILDSWTSPYIILRTRYNFISVALRDQYGMLANESVTTSDLVKELLTHVKWFKYTDKTGNHLERNIFYGCKSLEEVLMTRDLNSDKV